MKASKGRVIKAWIAGCGNPYYLGNTRGLVQSRCAEDCNKFQVCPLEPKPCTVTVEGVKP